MGRIVSVPEGLDLSHFLDRPWEIDFLERPHPLGCGSKLNGGGGGGVTQVLVHVSTYQGSNLVPVF